LLNALERAESLEELSGDGPRAWRSQLDALRRLGVRPIVPSDEEYPEELGVIDAAPLLLFVRGVPLHEMRPMVAIVGARACTSGAVRFARKLGDAFAAAGFTVVSGLARGIDAAAHRGALVSGRTVAVLGSGLDVCYPPEHRSLLEEVASNGAVVSEFPPGVGPRAWHFPARNRIISGLSCAVVVVEAGLRSGALITAGFALDHGRHVFACTTGPENPAGAGVRALLRDGATLIVDPEQAVECLIDLVADQGFAFGTPARQVARLMELSPELQKVYDAVTEDVTTDEIVTAGDLDPLRVSAALAELELEGVLEVRAGRWRRRD
jgi:DNA processing protein